MVNIMPAGIWESICEWRDARARPPSCRTLIVGPPEAGKTSYLAALNLAASQAFLGYDQLLCGLRPQNDAMIRLHEAAAIAVRRGRLPNKATEGVTPYSFSFEAEYPGVLTKVFFGRSKNIDFEVTDGPGGNMLPRANGTELPSLRNGNNPTVDQLMQAARKADSLIICVDGTDDSSAAALFQFVPRLFASLNSGELRFHSILLLMTKAEVYFGHLGEKAAQAALDANPWQRAVELLTHIGETSLLQQVDERKTRLYCSWVSAYGFLDDGRANFDPRTSRMRGQTDVAGRTEYLRHWRPFQVLDPLVYLSVREPGNLWRY